MISLFSKAKTIYAKYERWITAGALLLGFVVDNLTLQRIDLLFEKIVLFSYLSQVGIVIIYLNLYESGKLPGRKIIEWLRLFAPIVLQFALGGLYSAFFIFYFRSGSIGTSWPFLLLLISVMIFNEVYTEKLHKLSFQIGIFFISLFSLSIFYVPVIVKEIGASVFLLSGVISLFLIAVFIWILSRIDFNKYLENKKKIILTVLIIFFGINISYFTNIIPPIPLSLKNVQVAYNTERVGESYRVTIPDLAWHEKIFPNRTFEILRGQSVYIYSSVFAPTNLKTDIFHQWQFKNSKGKWQTASKVDFPIRGGRDGGYRGYSTLWNMEEGNWRVNIKTKTGQTIGRISFKVEYVERLPGIEVAVY